MLNPVIKPLSLEQFQTKVDQLGFLTAFLLKIVRKLLPGIEKMDSFSVMQ